MYDGEVPVVWYENDCMVVRMCPTCGRFLKKDTIKVEVNGLDQTRVSAECGRCGPVTPEYGYS